MKKIILSAFNTFGKYLTNPTEIIANRLDNNILAGFDVTSVVFDAVIPREDRGKYLLSLASQSGACGIISLGMDSGKTGLCIERSAVNRISGKYCLPSFNNTPVDRSREYKERLRLDLRGWNIKAFADVCRSENIAVMDETDDVGGFCCNHLIYQVAVQKMASPEFARIPFVFMHTPCSPQSVSDPSSFMKSGKILMTEEDVMRGLEILVERSLICGSSE